MTKSAKETWQAYVSSWKAETDAERNRLFEEALSPDCVYTDPLTQARGWKELKAYMAQFHAQIPGGHFVTQQFIAHHDCSIARWNMVNAKGETLSEGISYGRYDADGHLVNMTGFFDLPA